MTYEVEIVDSLEAIDEAAWDAVSVGVPFGSLRWIRLAEAVVKNYQARYLLLYRDGRLSGRAIVTLDSNPGMSVQHPLAQAVVQSLLQRYPMVYCQSPPAGLTNRSGLIVPDGDELKALEAITKALYQIALSRPTSLIVLGWLDACRGEQARQISDYVMLPESTKLLPICWTNFDDYLASLGKSARKDYRQHHNHAQRLGIQVERTRQYAQYADRLWELVQNVDLKYRNVGATPYVPAFFEIIERDLTDKSLMLLAWAEGKLVGCGLMVYDNGVLRPTLLGKDEHYPYVYFQIFYEMLRYAIENGFQVVYGGGGAEEFKRRLGFQEQRTYIAVTSHHTVLRWAMKYASNRFSSRETAEPDASEV